MTDALKRLEKMIEEVKPQIWDNPLFKVNYPTASNDPTIHGTMTITANEPVSNSQDTPQT